MTINTFCKHRSRRAKGKCSSCQKFNSCSVEKRMLDACYFYNLFDGENSLRIKKELDVCNIKYVGFVTVGILGELYKIFLNELRETDDPDLIMEYLKTITNHLRKFHILESLADTEDIYKELISCRCDERDKKHLSIAISHRIPIFLTSDNNLIGDKVKIAQVSSEKKGYKIKIGYNT